MSAAPPLAKYVAILARTSASRAASFAAIAAHPDRALRVIELRGQGLTQRAIAARIGVAQSTVCDILKAARELRGGSHGAQS